MPVDFDSLSEFEKALQEVDRLLALAETNEADEIIYSALNKSALLLLTGKFEKFAEHIAQEYVYCINDLCPCAHTIPPTLRINHSLYALRFIEQFRDKTRREEVVTVFTQIGKLWGSTDTFTTLNIDCKFAYGKHGEIELRKLFAQIGIEDIFDLVKIDEPKENLLADEAATTAVDFAGEFNSVTHLRNNILHQDATPQLSTNEIKRFVTLFREFSERLAEELGVLVEEVQRSCNV